MSNTCSKNLIRVGKAFAHLGRATTRMSVGTLFSGCEIFFVVLQMFLSVGNTIFGSSAEAELTWSVEHIKWKREFSHRRCPSQYTFDDIMSLMGNNWSGVDHNTGNMTELGWVSLCVAGFECDTVAKCAAVIPGRDRCMEKMLGKTGQTGRATLRCIVARRFGASLLENSSILGDENVRFICNYVNFFGFVVIAFQLSADKCGSPAARDRQYMLIVPIQFSALDQYGEGYELPQWMYEFTKALSDYMIGGGNPCEILLERHDPLYETWHQAAVRDRMVSNIKELEKAEMRAVARVNPNKKPRTEQEAQGQACWRAQDDRRFAR